MAQATLGRNTRSLPARPRSGAFPLALPAWLAPAMVLLLGLGLRLFRLNSNSLWVDEVYTIEYSRLPWDEVLGLRGAYDNHPPLYYALVKLTALVVPDVLAARVLSAITGTATILVLYLLVRWLVNRPAALLSSLILAVSPLHVWYSQDGRMYAPVALAVAVSYLLLVRFLDTPTRRLGVAYGLSLLVAMFVDYSALYALAPQLVIVGYLAWKRREVPRAWLVTAGAAAVIYLPWSLELLRTIAAIPEARDFLEVNGRKIFSSILTVTGLPDRHAYYWGDVMTPWREWPQLHPAAVAIVAALLFLSAVTLCGAYRLAFVTGLSLLAGTIATAAVTSYLVSPGYADRTVICAVLGWSMLAGAAPFGRVPNGARTISLVAIVVLLVVSTVGLAQVYREGQKEPYRSAANAAAEGSRFGFPIYADDFMMTAISAYHEGITVRSADEIGRAPGLWHAFGDYTWLADEHGPVQAELEALGYERVLHETFEDPFSTAPTADLYIRASAIVGERLSLPVWPEGFVRNAEATGWQVLGGEAALVSEPGAVPELAIYGISTADRAASVQVPAQAGSLYLLGLDYWVEIPAVGSAQVELSCISAEDGVLERQPTRLTAEELETAGWQRARVGIVCPEGTDGLQIGLSNAAVGELRFRNLALAELEPVVSSP